MTENEYLIRHHGSEFEDPAVERVVERLGENWRDVRDGEAPNLVIISSGVAHETRELIIEYNTKLGADAKIVVSTYLPDALEKSFNGALDPKRVLFIDRFHVQRNLDELDDFFQK